VLASLTAAKLYEHDIPVRILSRRSLRRYLIALKWQVREMPFIYRDLQGDLASDYVDVDYESLDPSSTVPQAKCAS
jgi:hypothetical protein